MPPLIECGWVKKDGLGCRDTLIEHGPTIDVSVGWMDSDDNDDAPDAEVVRALIDTGATQSCIDEELAKKLNLPIVDVITIAGVNGPNDHNLYAAEIVIPNLHYGQYGRFAGVHLTAGGQHQQVLLGRSFLFNTALIYDGCRGQVTLVF